MKIGVVTHELPWRGTAGGVASYLRSVIPGIAESGHEVIAFMPVRDHGLTTLEVPVTYARRWAPTNSIDQLAPPLLELCFSSWLEREHPDVVYVHNAHLLTYRLGRICTSMGIPYVLHVHDMAWYCHQTNLIQCTYPPPPACQLPVTEMQCADCAVSCGIAKSSDSIDAIKMIRSEGRYTIENAAQTVFVSEEIRRLFTEALEWNCAERSTVLWPAVRKPTSVIKPEWSEPVRFIMLGHMVPVKGADIALDAVAALAERGAWNDRAELHLHGDLDRNDPFSQNLLMRIGKLSGVHFHGKYDPEDLNKILANTQWLLCASRFEASPLVIHEVAGAGIPTIGADIGGISEKVGEGGILFKASSPDDLSKAMEKGLSKEVWDQCRSNLTSSPTIESQIRILEELFKEAITSDTDRLQVEVSTTREDVAMIVASDRDNENPVVASWLRQASNSKAKTIEFTESSDHADSDLSASLMIDRLDLGLSGWGEIYTKPDHARVAMKAASERCARHGWSYKRFANNKTPICSIVIPLFNNFSYTLKCLEALEKHTSYDMFEVVLVDNASTDETPQLLESLDGDVKVVRNKENLGFSKACNIGARVADGSIIVFLNNDTVPQAGWLEPLVDTLTTDTGTGIAGSRLLFPDGTIQHAGVAIVTDESNAMTIAPMHLHYQQRGDTEGALTRRRVSAVTGACLAITRQCLRDTGGFDERFWNGYEDIHLCLAARAKGWEITYEPASVLIHHESVSGPERFQRQRENLKMLSDYWEPLLDPEFIYTLDKNLISTNEAGVVGMRRETLQCCFKDHIQDVQAQVQAHQ